MKLKDYIEKLTDLKVDKENHEEVRGIVEGARLKYTETIEEVEGSKEQRSIIELRSAIEDLEQLKGLLESAEGLVDSIKSEIEEEAPKEEEEEVAEGEGTEPKQEEERGKEEVNKETIKNERGVDNMKDKEKLVRKLAAGNKNNYREAFREYIRSGEVMEGLKTDSEGVILKQEEIMGDDYERTEALDELVNVVPVVSKSGKHYQPDLSGASAMKTVEELVKSPENSGIGYIETDYSVVTYREAYKNSKELSDDMPEFDKYVVELTDEVVRLTKNKAILDAINDDTKIETKNFNTVADFITPGIKAQHRKGYVLSESKYHELARLTDSEGRFLLHNDLTKGVSPTIAGLPVVVKPDAEIGAETAIFGDLKAAVTFFDRQEVVVTWIEHQYWGKVLQPVLRFDVKVVKPEAIIKLTFNTDVEDLDELGE